MAGAKNDSKTVATLEESKSGIRGSITMDEGVVATIAGLAAREIDGIHSLGKSRLIAFGDNVKRGVDAEVGEKQAALDLDVVIKYGVDIVKVANQLRNSIADKVKQMAGREVIEVNIHVVDIKLPEETPEEPKSTSRVI